MHEITRAFRQGWIDSFSDMRLIVTIIFKIVGLLPITPFLFGAVVFVSMVVLLIGIVGWMYDAETTQPTAQSPKR